MMNNMFDIMISPPFGKVYLVVHELTEAQNFPSLT